MMTWLRILFPLVLCLLNGLPAHADVSAQLDRPRVAEGETVQLHIQTDGQSADQPDTTPLEQDFEVLGTSTNTQMSIVNGRMNATTSWQITLSPKHDGTLTIPSLQVGKEKTLPLQLEVSRAPLADDGQGGADVFIETEVVPTSPYVQEKLLYRVQIYYAIPLSQASLTDPTIDNALVRRLGEDRNYAKQRGGREYKVVERVYAVFPQTSGELTLPGPVLSARAPDRRRQSGFDSFFGRDPFNSLFSNTRPLRIRAEDQIIQVQPRPADAQGTNWLPAESLDIKETWQPGNQQIKVGEPLTRTLEIRATGLTGEQLPDIESTGQDGLKIYPDKAESSTNDLADSVEGIRKRSYALVATRAGRFNLPAITLRWWDTRAGRERLAELPARSIEVAPSPAEKIDQAAAPPASINSKEETATPLPTIGLDEASMAEKPDYNYWPWVSAFLAVLWLATLALWWLSRNRLPPSPSTLSPSIRDGSGSRIAKARFQEACKRNDAPAARSALLDWAANNWPEHPPRGLTDLSTRLGDAQTAIALAKLDQAVYKSQGTEWSAEELSRLLKQLPATEDSAASIPVLPTLYR